jgi:hypothetical protein
MPSMNLPCSTCLRPSTRSQTFVRYLDKKSAFCRSEVELIARSEQDVLALYSRNQATPGEHEFVPTEDAEYVIVDAGFWNDFQNSPERRAQIEWERVSYAWDAIIDRFAHHTLTASHEFALPANFSISDQLLCFLAHEPRARRRVLAAAFRDALHLSIPTERRVRDLVPQIAGEPHYVFLFFAKPSRATREQYRAKRLQFLAACCFATRLEHADIVGLAMESGLEEIVRSVNAAYFDARTWSDEDAAEARRLQQQFEIHVNPTV